MAVPTATPSALVEKATSDLLLNPDWTLNLSLCDIINQDPVYAKDIIRAVKKRLGNRNSKVQFLALTVLETLVKNCGQVVHQQVAEKDVLTEMVKIVKKKTDMRVRDKILELLDSWQEAFGGASGKYPQYYAVYEDLFRSGVEFPQRNADNEVPIFTPQKQAITAHPPPGFGSLGFTAPQVEAMASDVPSLRLADFEAARSAMSVLNEMLNAVDPKDKQAIMDDVIMDLVEQCHSYERRVMHLVNTTSDEELLRRGLALNDELQKVLARHNTILSVPPPPPPEHRERPNVDSISIDQQEDESEDEFSQLAHRSRTSKIQQQQQQQQQQLQQQYSRQDSRKEDRPITLPAPLLPPPPSRRPSLRQRELDLSDKTIPSQASASPPIITAPTPTSTTTSLALYAPSSSISTQQGSTYPFPPTTITTSNHFSASSLSPQKSLQNQQSSPYAASNGNPVYPYGGYNQYQSFPNVQSDGSSNFVVSPWVPSETGQFNNTLPSSPWAAPNPFSSNKTEFEQQFQADYHRSSSWNSNIPNQSSPHSLGKNMVPNQPMIPMLYAERQQQMNNNANGHNQWNPLSSSEPPLALGFSLPQGQSPPQKDASPSDNKHFADLVDLRNMNGAGNFKTAGITNSLSRPSINKASNS